MDATELRAQLCAAIQRRSLVMVEYGDLIRVVEPHRYGVNSAGHEMLSGWLRAGYSRSDPAGGWRSYLLTDVHALQVLDAPFAGTRPGYVAHDPRMRDVYCELTPTGADAPAEGPFVVHDANANPPTVEPAPHPDGETTAEPSQRATDPVRATDGETEPPASAG
jgi:hypothetical protein